MQKGTFEGSTSTAFNKPLPRTSAMNEQPLLCSASMAALLGEHARDAIAGAQQGGGGRPENVAHVIGTLHEALVLDDLCRRVTGGRSLNVAARHDGSRKKHLQSSNGSGTANRIAAECAAMSAGRDALAEKSRGQ
jgi:hypothetical protein